MRRRPEWMNPTDDLILQPLVDSGLVLSPSVIAYNIDLSRPHISRRLSVLEKHGLVEKLEDGYYRATERGQGYIAGELSIEDLEETEE